MTDTEFRNSPALRSELQALLDNPTMTVAINCITDKRLCEDALEREDAIVSIRKLSKRSGIETAFRELHELATPLPAPPRDPLPDYGSGLTHEQLAQAELPPPIQVS